MGRRGSIFCEIFAGVLETRPRDRNPPELKDLCWSRQSAVRDLDVAEPDFSQHFHQAQLIRRPPIRRIVIKTVAGVEHHDGV